MVSNISFKGSPQVVNFVRRPLEQNLPVSANTQEQMKKFAVGLKCSVGLSQMLSPEAMEKFLKEQLSPEEIASLKQLFSNLA